VRYSTIKLEQSVSKYSGFFKDLLSSGTITPVPGTVFEQMVLNDPQWPVEYQGAQFFTPTLAPVANWDGSPALYMEWGDGGGGGLTEGRIAAAWDYVYSLDPNLNNTRIDFSIFPPIISTMFSLNLIDKFGNYREWIWHAGGAPGDPVAGAWNSLWIDPVTGASNFNTFGGSPFIHNVVGSTFDLASITILRFNENISATAPGFPAGPGGNIPAGWVWNAWDHVGVNAVPEPSTFLLLGAGVGSLLLWRRNREKK
jgi:hypothetical protein